mgnify:FL=1
MKGTNVKRFTQSAFLYSLSLAVFLACCCLNASLVAAATVSSPDGSVRVEFSVEDGRPVYGVSCRGTAVVEDSGMGFGFQDSLPMDDGFEIVDTSTDSVDRTWETVCGERDTVRDRYNQLTVELRETKKPRRRLLIQFRAYDEGAAFRYVFPEQDNFRKFVIAAEDTEFRFTGDYPIWYHAHGGPPGRSTISKLGGRVARPITVKVRDDLYAAVGEAAMVNYSRMKFSGRKGNTLSSTLAGSVHFPPEKPRDLKGKDDVFTGPFDHYDELPFRTPWRVFVFGEDPGDLLERNYLILNLNAPCVLDDTSWIKPGKVMREVTLSTEGAKKLTDFAVERNLQYIHFDSGWYGPEWRRENDPTTIPDGKFRKYKNGNWMTTHVSDRLHEEIAYAKEHGVGVIVYVNHEQLEACDLDRVFSTYKKWGIDGVKFGFVHAGPQEWTNWMHYAIRKAAEYELVVNVHDAYVPTGWQRTFPNFLTMEGVRGDEGHPKPEQDLTTLFTRCVVGPTDHTWCYYSDWLDKTHGFQLAGAVAYYSPLQYLYWYDTPGEYKGERALEFWDSVPVTWDETKVINAAIGDYATVARRSGEDWYIGSLADEEGRELEVPLDFLQKGRKYVATIYTDAPDADPEKYPVPVVINEYVVDSTDTLKANLIPTGGQAVRLVPASAEDVERYPEYGAAGR